MDAKLQEAKSKLCKKKTAASLECMGQATRGRLVNLGVVLVVVEGGYR